ncbi:sugar ABC transporter ATP-binding protein [Peribacillus cavernae]|uniref:Sugar ABC transporter ATP-binding protein n=1 Tax=Peribacillus cavernae TaxID=1674310 RepID=A0A433HIK5_9BACI|nr:sugar ABC transporter ATP-binding protein [Peribacillus cavernae]MDQ0217722.1 ABC-type sugar transport system ATPase subunit [Peribacillus cavernae]RUQ28188.1 sugar ABC transporter ATP-binding protein [Peribacillus cavernae]
MPLFECKHISKTYGSVVAIQEASFSLEKGEIRAVLGGNGSGKSTLAKIIGGAVKPDAGELYFKGKPFEVNSPSQAKKLKVIITSQELSLLTNLTVEENLVLPSIPRKGRLFIDKNAMKAKASAILEKIGLSSELGVLVEDLPANKQFMVEFAKSLLQEPEILVIDEITSALFRQEVEIFKNIVRELSAKGCGILFISHRMSEIFSICDSVTVMRNGSVIDTFPISEVNEDMLVGMLTAYKENIGGQTKENRAIEQSDRVLLSVKDMTLKRFGTRVSLDAKQGEVIGIAGLQGQGQSDFVRTLYGLNGHVHIRLDDKELQIDSVHKSVQEGLAFLSGDREREGTFSVRSIAENLEAVNSSALSRKALNQKRLLDSYGVKYDNASQQIRNLSGGNQQKVVIARWTGTNPKVLIADDPTKGIDVQARGDVHEIFGDLAASGSVVIMVSSDDEELVHLTKPLKNSRIMVMYDGKFVKTLMGEDITVHNIISASLPREGVVGK